MSFIDKVLKSESSVIAIDFDGVIHKNSKGFFDGTVYDDPVIGAEEALKIISESYKVVIFSCKALPDRPIVDGMTGTEHIWKWLKKNNMSDYVSEVTHEKPRAALYIDDKGLRFSNWDSAIEFIRSNNV